jgi:nucleotide-binding universal stress UspA family protein
MKILATFDGSTRSEAIVPQLEWMARLPDAQFTFLSIAHCPQETARVGWPSQLTMARQAGLGSTPIAISAVAPTLVEDRGQAIERTLAERSDYLQHIASQMPQGPPYSVETTVADDVAAAIIRYAMEHEPDVIVMGTHGETGMMHRLFGDVAEQVVRSGVAPVLLVHSNSTRRSANK